MLLRDLIIVQVKMLTSLTIFLPLVTVTFVHDFLQVE